MDYPIYIDTLLARICPFCILRGHVHVKISLIKYIFVPEDCFILANSGDPDEMLPYAAFHLGLHCLPEYLFKKGLTLFMLCTQTSII